MTTNAFSLKGKKAVVTGGTDGIGLAVAKRFAQFGAEVIIASRRKEGSKIATQAGLSFIRCDVSDESQVKSLFQAVKEEFGKLDILVNNAGAASNEGFVSQGKMDTYDDTFNLNMRGAYLCCRVAVSLLVDGASIINTGSINGRFGSAGLAAYNASKAALSNFSKTLALELAPQGIRVNCVSPGPISTRYWPEDAPHTKQVTDLIPLGRVGKPAEVACLFHYLAADESRFITGQDIAIDGGWTAGLSQAVMGKVFS